MCAIDLKHIVSNNKGPYSLLIYYYNSLLFTGWLEYLVA